MKFSIPLPAWQRRAAAVALLGLLLLHPHPAAATLRYDLQIYGLVCGLCADGLEKNLKDLSNDVADIEVDLDAGHAVFVTTDNSIIDPQEIREAVVSVGFDTRALTLTATGSLEGSHEAPRLNIDDTTSIALGPGPAFESVQELLADKPTELTISGTLSGSGNSLHLHVVEVDPS